MSAGARQQQEALWALDVYEEQRSARPLLPDGICRLPYAEVSKLMKCPVCLNMLTETSTMKECLHRFCSQCISKSLRLGKKECPTCRMPCASRRSLRRDTHFDQLIGAVYPDRDEYERFHEALLQTISDHTNMRALAESVENGMKDQALHRNKKRKVFVADGYEVSACDIESGAYFRGDVVAKRSSPEPESKPPGPVNETTLRRPAKTALVPSSRDAPLVEFTLEPHSEEFNLPRLSHQFIACPGEVTMGHICQYIMILLCEEVEGLQTCDLQLFMASSEGAVVQGRKKCLRRAAAQHRADRLPGAMTIYYALKPGRL